MASEEEKADAAAAKACHNIHQAAQEGDVPAMRHFLRVAAESKHEKSFGGQTPLHSAAIYGRVAAAEFLISKGAAVDAKSKDGFTPLHSAAWYGRVAAAEFLLSKGAAVDAKTNSGKTPVELATLCGKPEMVQFLLNASVRDAVPKDPSSPAGSGAAAAKHQREVSKEEAARELKKAMESGNAKVLKEALDRAKSHKVSQEELMEAMDKYIALSTTEHGD